MKDNKKLLKSLITVGILAVVIVGMLVAYNNFKPKATKGSKEIVVDIVIPDEDTAQFTLNTDAEFLRQALEEESLISGSESEYGLYITEVNGHTSDDANQEWWCITKGGEQVNYGVDEIAISDGDHYEITLTVGY